MSTEEWQDQGKNKEPEEWKKLLAKLEEYAEQNNIQVLCVDDVCEVRIDQPPYLGNIVIDNNYTVAIPKPKHKVSISSYLIMGIVLSACAVIVVAGVIAIVAMVLGLLS